MFLFPSMFLTPTFGCRSGQITTSVHLVCVLQNGFPFHLSQFSNWNNVLVVLNSKTIFERLVQEKKGWKM